ncbi:MAG TPA: class I SAM-dependent methyltransferase, partial [Vicinamibacterales bacterium]
VRAKEAAANIQRAGLSDIVRVVPGDAFKEIPKVEGHFDMVFLDAWKPDYKKFFEMVFPRVTPGGLFMAHNVINKKNDMLDFLAAVEAHPMAFNTTVSPGYEGISITYKKR